MCLDVIIVVDIHHAQELLETICCFCLIVTFSLDLLLRTTA
uniref:Uncharacterized protein n=1 Tax=Rhizophora mucronata TaxID=61149 RepID=A0A2P2Q774_RHIMU